MPRNPYEPLTFVRDFRTLLCMEFEWDKNKTASNLSKHNLSFPYATRVFLDINRIECGINEEKYGEIRYKTIGKVGSEVLTVVYTKRDKDCRLISARRASRNERRMYKTKY